MLTRSLISRCRLGSSSILVQPTRRLCHSGAMASVSALKRWSSTENELPSINSVRHIHIYDFDNTLFGSPTPSRQVWQGPAIGMLQGQDSFATGGWWHDANILRATGEGMEKEEPRAWKGWWNEQVVQLVELSMQQKDALSILLTGRSRKGGFADIIQRMVKSRNLEFDMIVLKPELGPGEQKFSSTMKFKQAFIEDVLTTYVAADEIKIYEDRARHVEQFRDYLDQVERALTTTPVAPRKSFRRDVVEIIEDARSLDPLTEVFEIQKMINTHNAAYSAGSLPGYSKPWEIKKTVLYTAYMIKPEDTALLLAAANLPNKHPDSGIEGEYRTMANNIMITTRPCPSHILEKVGGLGHKVRWRAHSYGNFDGKVFAMRVNPVSSVERIHTETPFPIVVLAMKGNGKPYDATRIQHWMPLAPEDMVEFETEVSEKVVLRIEEERPQVAQTATPTGGFKRSRPMDEEFPALGSVRGGSNRGGPQQQNQRRDYHGKENGKPNAPANRGGRAKFEKFDTRGGGVQRGGSGRGGNQRGRGGSGGGRAGGAKGPYKSLDDGHERPDDQGLTY